MTRATRVRADQVLELLIAGLTRREILKWAAEKTEWKASDRSIDRLIAAAGEALEAAAAPRRAREFNKTLRRLDMLFARSLQITDFKACLAVERERIALLGLARTGPQIKRRTTRRNAAPTLRWGSVAKVESGG